MSTATCASAITFSLSPVDTTVGPGEAVVLRLVTNVAPDIKGVSLDWTYSPTRLSFVSAAAGGVITGSGAFVEFVRHDHASPPDSVGYDAAVLDGTGTGPGVVVFLRFNSHTVGTASITCLSAEVRDSQNIATFPFCTSSTIHVVGPVATRRTHWGDVKRIYR